jgi:hypothetical protein
MGREKKRKNKHKLKEDYYKQCKHSTRQSDHIVATLFYAEAESYGIDENIIKSVYKEYSDGEGNHTMTLSRKNRLGQRIKLIETEFFSQTEKYDPCATDGHPHVSGRIRIRYDISLEDRTENSIKKFQAADLSETVKNKMRELLRSYKEGGVTYSKRI